MELIVWQHRAHLTPQKYWINYSIKFCFWRIALKGVWISGWNYTANSQKGLMEMCTYVTRTWTAPWRHRFIYFTLILLAAWLTEHSDMGCQDITVIIAVTILRLSQSLPTLEEVETGCFCIRKLTFGERKELVFDLKSKTKQTQKLQRWII